MKLILHIFLSAAVAWVVCILTPCKTSSFTMKELRETENDYSELLKRIYEDEERVIILQAEVEALLGSQRK